MSEHKHYKIKDYKVPKAWKDRAYIDKDGYRKLYEKSIDKPDKFWGKEGKRIDWIKPYTKVKNTSFAYPDVSIKWFEDGTLNVAANCTDRHLKKRGKQTAIIFEPDDPKAEAQHISYRELHDNVCRLANVLKANGVKRGDRVTIYLPMIPEAAYAMLACARIGAVHSVVFGGFSPELARRAHRRLQVEAPHHRRRRLARRTQDPAQGQCRRGAEEGRRRRHGAGGRAHRGRGAVDQRPRPLAA